MKVGIIGLPNVGKSTLFNLLSRSKGAQAEDYPFCTIEPNIAKVLKYDSRLEHIATVNKSLKTLYSELEIVDIAGLIKNASEGEGLGNKFLANIRTVHSIIHVVRDFEGAMHVYDTNNCPRDYTIINNELMMADLRYLEKKKTKTEKEKKEIEFLMENLEDIKNPQDYSHYDLLSLKPQVLLINSDTTKGKIPNVEPIYLNVCELECMVNDLGMDNDGEIKKQVAALINAAHKTLGLIDYFTVGPKEARAWSIKEGSNAREAAGKIHSDFSKKFIKAEVYPWNKPQEKKLVGPDYIVKDGDVLLFRVGG